MSNSLLVLILAATAVIIFAAVLLFSRRGIPFRQITSVRRLIKAIDQSTADGKRVHIGLANGQFLSPMNASALAGLEVLRQVELDCLASESPAVATSSDAPSIMLAHDVIHVINRTRGQETLYDPGLARQTGVNPLTYAVGTAAANRNEGVQTQLVMGDFGPEILYLHDSMSKADGYSLSVSNSIAGQTAAYAISDDVLIGEELFALPAYLSGRKLHAASVLTQDILRWIAIILILVGVIIKVLSSLLVVPV